jgi:hypothetical protein
MSFVDKWMKCHFGNLFAMLECVWEYDMGLVAKKLYIITCELHRIYSIVYNIGCPLQLLQFVQ